MYKGFLCTFLSVFTACSCAQLPKNIDSQSAIEGNDLTALISGCGQQVTSGYLVCRMPEGATAYEEIFIHAPPHVECESEEACVYFRIYFPDGRPTYEGSVKKGHSFARVPWSEIVNKETFDLGDRGFYAVSVTLHYKDRDNMSRKTYADGYLFLHVVSREYISLIENEEDENFVWIWKAPSNQTIKMTTGFRVYLSAPKSIRPVWLDTSKL